MNVRMSAAALVVVASARCPSILVRSFAALIRQRYVPAVVYVKALHAMALDRWLATHHVALADLTEAHIVRFERRRRRCRGECVCRRDVPERRDVIGLLQYLRRNGACRRRAHQHPGR